MMQSAPFASGNQPSNSSAGGVDYFDGVINLPQTDLSSSGFGMPWSQTRSWSNGPYANTNANVNGNGIVVSDQPYLQQDGTSIIVVMNGHSAEYFDSPDSMTYTPRYFSQDQLTHDDVNSQYIFTDTSGDQIRFQDFTAALPAEQGQFDSFTDPFGNVTHVANRDSNGNPTEVQRSVTDNGNTIDESYLYTYLTSGANAGLLASVVLRRRTNGGAWQTVREADYAYYDGVEANGNQGDLKTSTIKDGSGNVLGTYYYRYYVSGEANGYAGGLKYVFSPRSYARLAANFADPATATDAQVAPYADLYLEYNAAKLVTKEVVQGAGASASGGLGTYTYIYEVSTNADGHNIWKRKTTVTLPDGNQNIVYTNFAGQVILNVFKDTSSGKEWDTFYKYDDNGRVLWHAHPSAVSGYDQSYSDLLNNQGGNYQYLRDSSGLINAYTYYTSTTAGEATPGGVAGYQYQTEIQRGETSTPILASAIDYFQHTAGSAAVSPVADVTVYRNSDGTGAETTSYSYTWFTGTAQVQSAQVTLPVISTSQNGPGGTTGDTATTYFDEFGRPIWVKDPDGFLHYTQYDPATGAVVKTITDVDTTKTGDFQNLPSGWTTPSGGGLHLMTQIEVDDLGRPTKVTDPAGKISYMVYDDPNHEERIYAGWDSTNNAPTGPTVVVRQDWANGYFETLTMSATPNVDANGRPDGSEAISNLESLARQYTNTAWQVTHADRYFDLSGIIYSTTPDLGTQNSNYYRTLYAYDDMGRSYKTTLPTGTIDQTDYDALGRPTATYTGTSDTNLVKLSDLVYDDGNVGDSNLTSLTVHPGGSAADRETDYFYDWRDRLVATKAGVQATEDASVNRPITYTEYDNLGEATASEQYDGDGVTITDTNGDGVPDKPSASLLRAKSTTSYDDQGRVYETSTYRVDPSTGAVSSTGLKTDYWYDHRGELVKTAAPGGLVSKFTHDGAGRLMVSYLTDGGGDSSWADALDVTGDAVLQQTENTYDADSNVIEVTTRQRFHDETATGALGDPTTAPKARVSYAGYYYDLGNRLTDTVDVGTNGGSAWTRPGTVPARSDTVLVNSQTYNSAGEVDTTTDPRGIVGKTYYDALGRVTKTIADYTDGVPTDNTNKTTEFTYDGDNNLVTVTADMPGGAYETTKYVYGVSTSTGSDVNSNDIVSAVQYPDKSTGDPSSSEQETYTVNALGQTKTASDRNGNVHSYSFDVLGRITSDAVTTLGTGVDGSVRRLETAYDGQGNPYLFTSYDAASGGNIVNQVERAFNGLGQLTDEWQSHSGAVNTSTTPEVQYTYNEMSGGANNSRLTSMIYPNGKVLDYVYNTGLDDTISRLSSLSDSTGTLEAYSYLGLNTVVKRAHSQIGVDLTYIKQSGESNGDAGDQYTGLDRFGRVDDQRWLNTSTGTATDEFKYGYDRDSNRLYRENAVDAVFSELYAYDNLNQLTSFDRGQLNSTKDGIVGTPSRSQSWSYDAVGNWNSLTTDGTEVDRTHNLQNQVTAVGSANLTFDSNGNMTTDENGNQLIYDAWNRLVEVQDSGSNTLASYSYNALGERTSQTENSTTTDLYYSANWQVLEEQVSGNTTTQYVWSPVYVDAMILRDHDTNGDGTLDQRLWVQQDANFNVTALLDNSGNVVERYVYDPYGSFTIYNSDWSSTRSSSIYDWLYLHQGGRYDTQSGLYSFRNRDYSPTLGRWTENDPTGFGGGDTNLYRALANAPTAVVDPRGLNALSDWFWGSLDSNYDRPAWRNGNFLEEPNPQMASGPSTGPAPGTAEWLYHGRAFQGGTLTAGSVGLRAGGVDGETVGETLVFGTGEMLGLATREQRENYVRTHAPVMDVMLGELGPGLAEGGQQYASFMRSNLQTIAGFNPISACFVAVDHLNEGDYAGAALTVATPLALGGAGRLGQSLGICNRGRLAQFGYNAAAGAAVFGGGDFAQQQWDIYQGRQQEYDFGRTMFAAGFGALLNGMLGTPPCFTGEMQVLTQHGYVRWDELQEGDEVASCNEHQPQGAVEYRRVEEVFRRLALIWHVHVQGHAIRTTAEHPFYVWGKGWTAVRDLEPGDRLRSHDGRVVVVEEVLETGVAERVYNCRVAEYHTYFVGKEEWGFSVWAHNACVSRIHDDPGLVREAEVAGRSVQRSIDNLTFQLGRGNFNPGIGTKNLFRNILYARARDGARVFFRRLPNGDAEILAKSSKANQNVVIGILQRLYGG